MDHQLRRRAVAGERGSVLVIVAIGVPVFVLLMALVLDIGNWYAHKRQVQNQVDAAALAAGVAYGYNFPLCTTPAGATATANIVNAAVEYGAKNGPLPVLPSPDPCAIHPAEGGADTFATPAGSIWTDVTVRDDIQSLFGGFGVSLTHVSAKARVAVLQMQGSNTLRPFATADASHTDCAWVSAGDTTVPLNPPTAAAPFTWSVDGAAFPTPASAQALPIDVTLGEKTGTACPPAPGADAITYAKVGSIAVWERDPDNPWFGGMTFIGDNGCNPYFVPRDGGACTFNVSAEVHFDRCDPDNPPQVTLHLVGDVDRTFPLAPEDPCNNDTFVGDADVAPGFGTDADGTVAAWIHYDNRPNPNGNPPGSPEVGDLPGLPGNPLQTIMAGDDRWEGPIASFTFSDGDASTEDGIVGEDIRLTLAPLRTTGPTVLLRGTTGTNRSLSSSISCTSPVQPPQLPQDDPIRRGCSGQFLRTAAPSSACTAEDKHCVTGAAASGVAMNCSPNNWAKGLLNIPRGDPRLITVAVTPVGAAFANGAQHSIVDFAAFYVTGWDGDRACGDVDQEAKPPGQTTFPGGGGAIWGHFVKFVQASSNGVPDTEKPCDPQTAQNGVSACIATLVQ
jgi:hypothetical protein